MALGEMIIYIALGLTLVLLALFILQARRLARLEATLKALVVGTDTGAQRISLVDLVSWQGKRLDKLRSEVEDISSKVETLQAVTQRSVQYVGLVRYNPFGDTGGDQSFALALLDARGNGVVMSSLHTRTATRFYAKAVKGGASSLSLSDEEASALKQAMEAVPEQGAQFASR